jgi:RHS repeat-associated protein
VVAKTVRLANGAERRDYYDFSGRLIRQEDPDSAWLRYDYDDDGQVSRLTHASGARVDFSHEARTREFRAVTDRTETSILLDEAGFPVAITTRIDGREWSIAYQRDARGTIVAYRYPQSADWLRLERTTAEEEQARRLTISCGEQVYLEAYTNRIMGKTVARFANGARSEEFWREAPAAIQRIMHCDADGQLCLDMSYEQNEQNADGRLARAGAQQFSYDEHGRLAACTSPYSERRYVYDAQGRMVETWRDGRQSTRSYGNAPHVEMLNTEAGASVVFTYDAVGRRVRRDGVDGVSRYTYNLCGQLETVTLPDGGEIRYLYDGFGRLVGRETGDSVTYFLVGIDGERLAEANVDGCVTHSYLWLGLQCVGRVDGPLGGPLSASFHRVHGGRLAGVVDVDGHWQAMPVDDPYGADAPILPATPGYASLFGDPCTQLLHAGARWLDPAIGQFLTADSWYGVDAGAQTPRALRRVLDLTPGGTGRAFSPAAAYNWCNNDPVNFLDPTGHNWLGMVWSFISAFLWEMQLTSLALQMEVINLVLEVLQWFPLFRPAWDWDGYWQTSIANGNLPLASGRLMVPFAFPLNGVLRFHDRGWTLGNIIWVRGDKWRSIERTSKRDLLLCDNASSYVAATGEAAINIYRTRSPHAIGTATVDAAGAQLTGVAITTPPGAGAVTTVMNTNDWLAIRLTGAATDELRSIAGVPAAGVFNLAGLALPNNYRGQAVQITRLDSALVKVEKAGKLIARTVTFIRGQAIHFARQIPEGFPTDGLTVTEYMPSGVRNPRTVNAPREAALVRLAAAADLSAFAVDDFLRIRGGTTYFARRVARVRASTDLVLDTPLPAPTPPTTYSPAEVVKLDASGGPENNQTATGDRVHVGTLTALRRFDGLAIENVGGAPAAIERRIAVQLFLECVVAALPAGLLGVGVDVHLLTPDGSVQAAGTVSSPTQIATTAGQAGRFSGGQPVRVRKAPGTDAFATVTAVDAANNLISLDEALPAVDFPNGAAVTVTLLTAGRRFEAENVTAPGSAVVIKITTPTELNQNEVIRIRLAAGATGGAVRRITAAPTVVAQLDSALPASHVNNLTVRRFAPVAATLRANASLPLVQLRLQIQGAGATNPYSIGDTLFVSGGEEAWGQVQGASGLDVILADPIEYALNVTNLSVVAITPTGVSSANGRLDEARVLIPSDPDEEPVTRREAFEQHEMRHVWQGAAWGPFLLSLPIPWLVQQGFSFTSLAHSGSQVVRHIGLGGLDSLFALIAWGIGEGASKIGIGEAPSGASLEGEIGDAARKTVIFRSAASDSEIGAFSTGSPIEITKGDFSTFNIVDAVSIAEKKITLRFALEEDRFTVNTVVRASVSPFEKIRSVVNQWFSLNLERLWSDHIPVAWGRVLSRFLNRDGWFPLGLYPLSLLAAGFDEDRLPNEQDAAYHSGDLYTNILLSNPTEIFVGQFSRIFAFIQARVPGDELARGLSDTGAPLNILQVQLPAGGSAADVAGAVPTTATSVRFRENYYIPLSDKVENAVGAFFAASRPGIYTLTAIDPGGSNTLDLAKTVVFKFAFDVDFLEQRKLTIKPLTVTPTPTAAAPVFETEEVRFTISGDSSAAYQIRYRGAPPAPPGTIAGLRFTAPVLPAGSATATHQLEIIAAYPEAHPVFRGPGQSGASRLTAEQRTNVCQALDVVINQLVAPVIPAVSAGATTTFPMPIAPRSVNITSPLPAGAAINARVLIGGGRPAQLTFLAPNAVSAPTTVTFEMRFGSAGNQKTVTVSVLVNP